MPPLIDVTANFAHYGLTPPTYAALVRALGSNSRAQNLAIHGNSGSVSYESVEFDWSYDGLATLTVTIVKKHSWAAKIVPNATIFDELDAQLISPAASHSS